MANNDEISNGLSKRDGDTLDRMIDAALQRYASTEPRAGLEDRILANLHAAELGTESRAWWIWGFVAAMAAIIFVAGTFAWRWSKPAHPSVANLPAIEQRPVAPRLATREAAPAPRRRVPRRVAARATEYELAATNPKLDVFPSPLPLSEQEKILAFYVRQYPEHAALVAAARINDLRQEEKERREIVAGEWGEKQ